jgi:hypothetical protein
MSIADGERSLDRLLATLDPVLHAGRWAFVTRPHDAPPPDAAVAMVREPEATTWVVAEAAAQAAGSPVTFTSEWLTLTVHSALDAHGLTAAFATALAGAGIACNVIAGTYHDHLFVPAGEGARALACLRALQQRHAAAARETT